MYLPYHVSICERPIRTFTESILEGKKITELRLMLVSVSIGLVIFFPSSIGWISELDTNIVERRLILSRQKYD